MADIVHDLDGRAETVELDKLLRENKFKVLSKTKELKSFNLTMADKSKELNLKFASHCKILEKIQEDLQYIHQTIKLVEQLDQQNPA